MGIDPPEAIVVLKEKTFFTCHLTSEHVIATLRWTGPDGATIDPGDITAPEQRFCAAPTGSAGQLVSWSFGHIEVDNKFVNVFDFEDNLDLKLWMI